MERAASGLDAVARTVLLGLLEVAKPKSSKKSSALTGCFFTTGSSAGLGGDDGASCVGGGGADSGFACSGFFNPPDRFTAKPRFVGAAELVALLSGEPGKRIPVLPPPPPPLFKDDVGDRLRRWYAVRVVRDGGVAWTISTWRFLRGFGSSSQPHSASLSFSAKDLCHK